MTLGHILARHIGHKYNVASHMRCPSYVVACGCGCTLKKLKNHQIFTMNFHTYKRSAPASNLLSFVTGHRELIIYWWLLSKERDCLLYWRLL